MEDNKFIILDLESLILITDDAGDTHTFETKEEADVYSQDLAFYCKIIKV